MLGTAGRQGAESSLTCSARGYEETVMDGPGIVSAQLGGNGACEFRTAKGLFKPETSISDITYALHFTATYPWEAFDGQGAEAMQYSLFYDGAAEALVPNIIMYGGVKNGVLYRKQYFDFHHNFQGGASIDLADFRWQTATFGWIKCVFPTNHLH